MASPAKCCKQALQDATNRWPSRNRLSDGIMGDAAHKKRKSDHNLGNAYDLTHDPANGVDCHTLSRQVINDPRVTYVIWNHRIYNRSRAAEGWRNYTGANPHTKHMHVSIRAAARDNLSPWPWSVGGASATQPAQPEATTPTMTGATLRLNSRGTDVRTLQQRLVTWLMMSQDEVDGIFGHGTLAVVKEFQRRQGLTIDGVVGPATWRLLFGSPPPVAVKKSMTRKIAKKSAQKTATKPAKRGVSKVAAKKRGSKASSKKR
jgi:hypothetical protein